MHLPLVTVLGSIFRSDEELKPDSCLVLEEDEGFSDWSHRLENRSEPDSQDDCRMKEQRPSALPGLEEEGKQPEGEDDRREPQQCFQSEEASVQPPEKVQLSLQHKTLNPKNTCIMSIRADKLQKSFNLQCPRQNVQFIFLKNYLRFNIYYLNQFLRRICRV